MRTRSYWTNDGRGFANEFVLGISRTPKEDAAYRNDTNWRRINRKLALRLARMRGDSVTTMHVGFLVGQLVADREGYIQAVQS